MPSAHPAAPAPAPTSRTTAWWLPPLLGTLAAAALAWLCSDPLRGPGTPGFWLLGYLVPVALLAGAWLSPRGPAHHARRVLLGALACLWTAVYVPLLYVVVTVVLVAMLLTGHVRS
ncbi:hypothetical protein QCN29_12785 [Streptomyces sp. HNM0663]|uniref:Integral membrane protein n=1 Tax=Streptomyces chengmaiensis TaxID=3040919 RepID=A0ABT6HLP4_9ACTN|nr:hypothetical protein [Streptomyces chengmaiensis]MDH2389653.1 hypothetical protein [Streptomyces chengmaiensis]